MKSLFATISLSVAFTAFAQHTHDHPDSDHLHLEKFEVSTHPYARSQHEIAQPTSVLGGQALETRPALNLGELVAQEPGVNSSYFGPGAGRPVIRGMAGPRVAVLQNGSDMIDASTISPDHAVSLDPLLIERVEITRGPAALLQGGSAIGGAVNVVTHRIHATQPPSGVHGRIEGRVGDSDDERSGGLVLEGGLENMAWHLDAFNRETGNIEIPGFAESVTLRRLEALEEHEEEHHDEDEDEHHEEDEEYHEDEEAFGTLPNSWVESSGGAAGLSWIGDRGYIGASFSFFDTRYGIPPGAHSHEHGDEHDAEHDEEEEHHDEEEHHEEEEEEFVSIDLEQRRFEIEGELHEPFAGLQALQWHWAWAHYEHTEFEGAEVGTVFANGGHDLRIDALHTPWGDWQGAFGAEWSISDFDAVGAEAFVPPTETETVSFMLFEELERGPTIWQLSARMDAQSIDVSDGSGRTADGTGWATSLGIVHDLEEAWKLSTSLSFTERLPLAQELFADGPHIGTNAFEVGNAALDNERSLGLDMSLHRESELLSGTLTGFVNKFDGYIYENPTGAEEDGLPVYEFAQRNARFYGVEAQGMLHLVQSESGHLDLTFGMDFVHAENETDGTYLPRTPPWRWRTGFTWHRGPWRAGSEIVFAEGADRLAPGELRTNAYELWSAYAGYRFIAGKTTWDLMLRGSNLTDSEARLHTSFLKDVAPLPGRKITASVRMSF
ncbi:MAG: TonB-dependent receptor [Opitutaceae bacterium]|jgi:iron complex outermembrane recepter protein|nr:TonB-dependent receptor [Opitutaceae bacterium]